MPPWAITPRLLHERESVLIRAESAANALQDDRFGSDTIAARFLKIA